MLKAVIFDLFETLVTEWGRPKYLAREVAADLGVGYQAFITEWRALGRDMYLGKYPKVEHAYEKILDNMGISRDKQLIATVAQKRTKCKSACFDVIDPKIMGMLSALKAMGYKIGLISNCSPEEIVGMRECELHAYLDAVVLSCDVGMAKPDVEIYEYCLSLLGVNALDSCFVGDGGSDELCGADRTGMMPLRALWFVKHFAENYDYDKNFNAFYEPEEIVEYILDNVPPETYNNAIEFLKLAKGDMLMDKEQKSNIVPTVISLDEALTQITAQPKRQYTQQEIDEARDNLALMNDRVFLVTFMDNKNNHIITGIADAVRKIHALPPIPQVEQTTVQNISLLDVLGRGMIGDLLGWGESITIALEVQKGKQDGYAARGTLTSSNAMRMGFNAGDDFTDAPDVIGINILGFRLPQLEHRKEFVSRIVRAEYESKEPFLADKYSDYYIELPKMDDWLKGELPEAYHDLWDLCCIFRAKIKEHKEVIRMQAISNPVALELSREAIKTVTPNDFVNTTLDRKGELEQLKEYVLRCEQKREISGMEKMIIMALQSNTPIEFVEAMRVKAGITDARFAELRAQARQAS